MGSVASLSYSDALAYLYPRTQNYKFGLDRTERLLQSLGNPHRLFPVVHVGGTNGKVTSRSTCRMEWLGGPHAA